MTGPAPLRRPAMPGASRIGRDAVRALYAEVALHPKPGLVSPIDSGAHHDMDMRTFMRSLFALRGYFPAIAAAGADDADFDPLRRLGIAAERRMLAATSGVNTHRGAIFSLGLLAAAAGRLDAAGGSRRGDALGRTVRDCWGNGILAAGTGAPASHGTDAVQRFGARGVRQEAAEGFPLLFRTAVPTLRETRVRTGDRDAALVQTLFVLIAALDDTNLLHRGGIEGLCFARRQAAAFLDQGGVHDPGWRARAVAVHRAFVARRLSSGGAADMLAAAWFIDRLTEGTP